MAFSFGKPAAPAGGTGFGFGAPAQAAPAASTGGFGFGAQQAQPAQPAPTGMGLFGSQAAAAPAGGGMFGSTAAAPAAGGGMFGAKPAGSGGLFGSTASAPAAPTGGLFGSTAGAAAPAGGSGLFGAKPAGTGLFGSSPASGAGGLFGSMNAAQPAAGGGLFGQQSTVQPAAGGGLFGQQSTAQPAAGGGLFGQQSTAQPAAGGLFGSTAAQPGTSSLFGAPKPAGSSLFGQQGAAQPAVNPLQASTGAGPSGLTKSTKFSDLPDGVQKTIEQMDAWIKDQKQIGGGIDTETVGRAIWQTSSDVKSASDENAAITQGLHSLKQSLDQLGARASAESVDLMKFLEMWEASKPADARHSNIRPVAHRDFAQEFFFRVAQSLEERVNRYKRNIALLTRAVNSLANEQDTLSPQVVAQTIQNNQQAIISLAAQLEGLNVRMNALRADFTDDYRERTNSMRDPFEAAREEKGLPIVRT